MKLNRLLRPLALVLCLALIFSSIPLSLTAHAADATVGGEPGDGEETVDIYADSIDVSSANELEEALANASRAIRIVDDFKLDRTFYVISDTVIYAEEPHTLTRGDNFGGDIFVIGQYEDGTVCETTVLFYAGRDDDETTNLLTIDGNRGNMGVEVVGTVFFGCENADVSLYPGLTVQNCLKEGNERTLSGKYEVSYPARVGGPVAINAGGVLSIYGGRYLNNSVNDEVESDDLDVALRSTQGGAFYLYGTTNVYGGTFKNNFAQRGGVFYAYRTLNIYGATVEDNVSSTAGGAIYMPASGLSKVYIDGQSDLSENDIIFKNNLAETHGGAIYASGAEISINSATFDGNAAKTHGGAIYGSVSGDEESGAKITIAGSTFQNNTADFNGGALYLTSTAVYMEEVAFNGNHAKAVANANGDRYGGGAIYATGSFVEINGATLQNNTSDYFGGGIEAHSSSKVVLNKITTSGNESESNGGFIYSNNSEFEIYNSAIRANHAGNQGGAVFVTGSSNLEAYLTTFENNSSKGNGGALLLYTGTDGSILHSCVFLENTSGNYGGGIYISKATTLNAYNTSAKGNQAFRGGFLYETTTGTVVTLNGLSVSGNQASDGGPIIWGNSAGAKLFINKSTYVDVDYTDVLDSAYWAKAIVNSLKVSEISDPIPGFINYGDSEETKPEDIVNPNVTNVVELQTALNAGLKKITIISDFFINRTLFVNSDTTIYATGNRTLTRAPGFGGDMFVVGEAADGTAPEKEISVTIDPSGEGNSLTIDGNKDNMTADVVGTIFFVCHDARLSLMDSLTARNCHKVGNERTFNEAYGVSYPVRIGGPVAINANGKLDIYGGTYTNNSVNDETEEDPDWTSTQGGVVYSFGPTNIYGGSFVGNHAARGGFLYNYRKTHIYNAEIADNSASTLGGAIYMADSTGCYLFLGETTHLGDSRVIFKNNQSEGNGGAILSQGALTQVENTSFINNKTNGSGAAIWAAGDGINPEKLDFVIEDTVFSGGFAKLNAGAVYLSKASASFKNVEFKNNHADTNTTSTRYGGGAMYTTGTYALFEGVRFTDNTSNYAGGAVYFNSASEVTLYNVTATGNSATSSGGFMYTRSFVDIYNSDISYNTCESSAGAITFQTDAVSNIYSTTFKGNQGTNGGAFNVYTGGSLITVNNCRFVENVASTYGGAIYASGKGQLEMYNSVAERNSASRGGFLYETTTGTNVTLSAVTVSDNTASDLGPIICGNSTGAKLYINKKNFKDTATSNLDSAYWKAAIANKLTVVEITTDAPACGEYGNENYDALKNCVEVSTATELEAAINAGEPIIRIVADFTVDRTFYIGKNTTIFSTTPYRLTRASDFAGEFFVVGQSANGKNHLLGGKTAVLTLGNPDSATEGLLILDGNDSNMTVPVNGSVLFVCFSATANVYNNVSVVNAHKAGNKRALKEEYSVSSPTRIGGAFATVESGTLNIYGGNYRNIAVNDAVAATEDNDGYNSAFGGAIFNNGELAIYGGTFDFCKGSRGGVVYNNCMTRIYGGTFINNYASYSGGAIYQPSSALANLYVGDNTGTVTVTFKGNVAKSGGGAITTSTKSSTIIYGDTLFESNEAQKGSGGAISATGTLLANNITFKKNKAGSYGGAAYVNKSKDIQGSLPKFDNCIFQQNEASSGGALMANGSTSSETGGSFVTIENSTFKNNTAKNSGGALYASGKSTINLADVTLTGNSCAKEGGALYMVYESSANLENCTFSKNTAGTEDTGYGGAISLHSSFVNGKELSFSKNSAGLRGGAMYISYNSASKADSQVNITGVDFLENASSYSGGAIYMTDRTISYGNDEEGNPLPKEDRGILNLVLDDARFEGNTAEMQGGALFITTYAHAFMSNAHFINNSLTVEETSHNAGAIYSASRATFEINGGTFTGNRSGANAGAIGMYSNSSAVLNNIEATGNSAPRSGGFMHCDTAHATIYNSNISQNTAVAASGGAISYVDLSTLKAYNTQFNGNTAPNNGGALYVYPGASQSVLHGCSFNGNSSGSLGGAIYIANASLLDMYNTEATNNSAAKGGFLYETTKGSVVKINGLTVSGNTDENGGPIIWGNTLNAKLFINKANYVDKDAATLDDAYWAGAIYNLLTVGDLEENIPEMPTYSPSYVPTTEKPPVEYPEISVEHIFELAENADHGKINTTYAAFPKLDNSSNFMSRSTTLFPNINGEDVTVDSFIYHKDDPANNGNVGEGLMIYQAMLYKRANPTEDVTIALSAYRLSAHTAICIDRDSPYFGYMRALYDQEYDKFGFVRISYLLLCAARMGINVTVIGQLDGYPNTATSPKFSTYFSEKMNAPCDSAYVKGGVIGDYLTFGDCKWSLEGKGGSDMMHTKLCAVSHYLDKDGNVHKNAVWTSSSNLDGINWNGTNGLNQLQTATIVSDHAEIFNVSVNYLNLMAQYCDQEDVYYFRDITHKIFKEQIDLINAGRGDEIPADQKMVYLGTENDNVFELYFSPFTGSLSAWEEDYNPFSKQVRELHNSEDSIIFIWNNVKFGAYTLRNQLEEVIIDAFKENKNPENKIYVNLPGFNSAAFNNLEIGTDIGYKAFNQNDFGHVHSKDMHLSYVKDGQRYYVSLLNSMNVHSGSMSYQSNFALVIKETNCDEGSVFFTFADQTTTGIVSHEFQDTILEHIPENEKEDGYTYHPCANCDEREIVDVIHRYGDWIEVREANAEQNGIAQRSCTACGELLETREYVFAGEDKVLHSEFFSFERFSSSKNLQSALSVSGAPKTIEATIQLDKTFNDRAGVIVGNYEGTKDNLINLEVSTYGRIRLYVKNNGVLSEHIFRTDIRSDKAVHVAVTVDGTTANLYINSKLTETATLSTSIPVPSGRMWIGGDNRPGNTQYFKGSIYSVNLFDHVRTEEEISRDMLAVFANEKGLLASKYFTNSKIVSRVGTTFTETTSHEVGTLATTPKTIEATVQLSESFSSRAGVIFGNYENMSSGALSLEIESGGRVRVYYIAEDGLPVDYIFNTDIRGTDPVHLAVTINGKTITLYINGDAFRSITPKRALGDVTERFKIGGDNRPGNAQYFKGVIRDVAVFGDARTADEIKADLTHVSEDADNLLYSHTFTESKTEIVPDLVTPAGITFNANSNMSTGVLSTAPQTIEATIQLDKNYAERGGVIVGNYNETSKNQMSLEVYSEGRIRLFVANNVAKTATHIFKTDIRGDRAVHIAVTVEGTTAKLYVNSVLTETAELSMGLPTMTTGLKIGGDNRQGNTQFFKGTLYSVNLFSSVRTAEQIAQDMLFVDNDTDGLMYSKNFANTIKEKDVYGVVFDEASAIALDTLAASPKTFEATVQLGKDYHDRGGVIVGNFTDLVSDSISLEIHYSGRVRLFYALDKARQVDCIFSTDIRGSEPIHLAVTIDGLTANLFVNGEFAESKTLAVAPLEQTEGFKIGGDNRPDNSKYFKGAIYNVSLFGDVRTAEEIKSDMIGVSSSAEDLLFTDVLGKAPAEIPFESVPVGEGFSVGGSYQIGKALTAVPNTFEAVLALSPEHEGRGGVIVGNYKDGTSSELNLEIHQGGRPRLYYINADGAVTNCIFDTDIRSEKAVHIAVTVDGLTATLYVNGVLAEQKALAFEIPNVTENFKIGSDNRAGNVQFFKGTLYSVNLFSGARTSEQIASDVILIDSNDASLIYGARFATTHCSLNGHTVSNTIVDIPLSEKFNELRHVECLVCGRIVEYIETPRITEVVEHRIWSGATGLNPSVDRHGYAIEEDFDSTPKTIEAMIQLDKSFGLRAGVIVGNYDASGANQLNVEIYTNGRPRLYYSIGASTYSYIFNTDIRSDKLTHMAITVDGLEAHLYVNGELRETMALKAALPDTLANLKIGHDNRTGTQQYFAGKIYSVNLFSDVRTAEEIAIDRYLCPSQSEDMVLDVDFLDAE